MEEEEEKEEVHEVNGEGWGGGIGWGWWVRTYLQLISWTSYPGSPRWPAGRQDILHVKKNIFYQVKGTEEKTLTGE